MEHCSQNKLHVLLKVKYWAYVSTTTFHRMRPLSFFPLMLSTFHKLLLFAKKHLCYGPLMRVLFSCARECIVSAIVLLVRRENSSISKFPRFQSPISFYFLFSLPLEISLDSCLSWDPIGYREGASNQILGVSINSLSRGQVNEVITIFFCSFQQLHSCRSWTLEGLYELIRHLQGP